MIVIREFRHDRCRHCNQAHAQRGVVIEYCGVREFYCLQGLHQFLERLSDMPGVTGVLAEAAGQKVVEVPVPEELKPGQRR